MKFISPLNIVFYFLLVSLLYLLKPGAIYAQSNFYKIGLGAGVGVTQSFGDVYNKGTSVAAYASADYYFTPYINIGVEFQKGKIVGGDSTDRAVYFRQFKNDYQSFLLQAKVQLGILVDYQTSGFLNAVRGLYLGGGIGIINNNHKHRVGVWRDDAGQVVEVFPGTASSTEAFVPLSFGINIYYPDRIGTNRLIVNFNYQTNISFGEGIDGYDNSIRSFKTGVPDMYVFLTAGIKYQFGIVGLSRKSFRKI